MWIWPKCSLTGEWKSKTCHIHTKQCKVALKREGFLTHALTRRDLESIMLSGMCRKEEDKYCIIPFIFPWIGKFIETDSRIQYRSAELGKWGVIVEWMSSFFLFMGIFMRISPLLFQGVACLFMSWSEVNWKSLSGVWLFATPWTIWVHGILQTRILEWVAYLFSSGSSRPRN